MLAAVQAGAGFAGARCARSLDSGCARCGGLGMPASERARGASFMALQVAELSLELIETLRPLMPRIKQRDKSLADQILRAATSIALNIGEAGARGKRLQPCAWPWPGGTSRRKMGRQPLR